MERGDLLMITSNHRGDVIVDNADFCRLGKSPNPSSAHEAALRCILDKCCRDIDFRAKDINHWHLQLRVLENEPDMKHSLAELEVGADAFEDPMAAQ